MVVPCLLCQCGSFTDLPSLISSLSGLAGGPLVCPLSHCGHTEVGLDNLIRHLSSHQAADSSTDNIEQVIRDLEDLVQTDINLKPDSPVAAPVVMGQGEGSWITDWTVPTASSLAEYPAASSSNYYPPPPSHTNLTMKGTTAQSKVWGELVKTVY